MKQGRARQEKMVGLSTKKAMQTLKNPVCLQVEDVNIYSLKPVYKFYQG